MELKDLRPIAPVAGNPTVELFWKLSHISSTTEKAALLEANKTALVEKILFDAYGPDKYGLTKFDYIGTGNKTIENNYDEWRAFLRKLSSRELTGNAARAEAMNLFSDFAATDQIWLYRILLKNLKIGIGDTFSKDSGVVQKYPCALAESLKDAKNVDPLDGNWLVSRKLDGCRCHMHVTVTSDGEVHLRPISRQGKEFETLHNLDEAFTQLFRHLKGTNWVVDGEVCLVDEQGNEDFRGLMSLVTRKNFTIERPMYNAFDLLTLDEFWGHAESPKFSERLARLQQIYNDATNGGMFGQDIDRVFKILQQERLTSQEQFDAWETKRAQGKWEGIMIRKDVPYKGKRSKDILKIKPMQRDEYIVTGIIEGDMNYNTTSGSETIHGVSALTIEHKGNVVKVGSGMTKEQRLRWFEHPEEIIGKEIAVQYFEESKDSKTGLYSLRFPTLIYVYEQGRTV